LGDLQRDGRGGGRLIDSLRSPPRRARGAARLTSSAAART